MRPIARKKENEDDSLFGLLASYKNLFSYIRVLESEENDTVVVIVASNPSVINAIIAQRYAHFSSIRKIKMGVSKLFIKYISPQLLLKYYGPLLGMKIPENKVHVISNIDEGYVILEISAQYKDHVVQCIKKLASLSPQKKYEIIEKSFAEQEVEI